MNYAYLGIIAGILTSLAFFSQFVKVLNTRSVKDISLWWLCLYGASVVLWVVYGLFEGDLPLIMTYGFLTFILFCLIVAKCSF